MELALSLSMVYTNVNARFIFHIFSQESLNAMNAKENAMNAMCLNDLIAFIAKKHCINLSAQQFPDFGKRFNNSKCC